MEKRCEGAERIGMGQQGEVVGGRRGAKESWGEGFKIHGNG